MECPFKIEPHQIQGLDYLHIFPVIKWLVKKAIETRQAEGDEVRAFAVNQYHKKHGQIEVPEPEIDLNGIKHVQDRCKPKRIYRRKDQETETVRFFYLTVGYMYLVMNFQRRTYKITSKSRTETCFSYKKLILFVLCTNLFISILKVCFLKESHFI